MYYSLKKLWIAVELFLTENKNTEQWGFKYSD